MCKQFVANRILAIREADENGIWRHVQGIENPADLLTRGIGADQLSCSSLWWHATSWLAGPKTDWPIPNITSLTAEQKVTLETEDNIVTNSNPAEMYRFKSGKIVGMVVCTIVVPLSIYDTNGKQEPITLRRSELSSLLRVTAYVFRFVHNMKCARLNKRAKSCGQKTTQRCDRSTIPAITNTERQQALRYWITDAQRAYFSPEIKAIHSKRPLPRSSTIIKLVPIIDSSGFLRVGGRLANADIPEETKHPLILPPQARISQLIIRDAHFSTIHGGPQLMLAHLRRSYWITRARQIVKSVVHHCPICVRCVTTRCKTYS